MSAGTKWRQQPQQQQLETEQMAAMGESKARARAQSGIWIAYYPDRSGLLIFDSEVKALRHAVAHNMNVSTVAFGEDVWGAVL